MDARLLGPDEEGKCGGGNQATDQESCYEYRNGLTNGSAPEKLRWQ
ncbi:hypothetical protein [Neorhodopirellula lusitana]